MNLTNTVSASASTPDPVAANNNGSSAASTTITAVQPQADIVVQSSGPTVVLGGSNLTYTVMVTNLGPSTGTNVVVSDLLPASISFINASGGGVFSNQTVRWPAIASLVAGAGASFNITVTAPANGAFTNVALGNATTPDPNAANNNGSLPAAQVITTAASSQGQFGFRVVTNGINPQTGLYEESVTVTNTGLITAAAVRLFVDGLRSGVTLYNAAGTNTGRPYAQYDAPLNPGQAITFLLEFYVPDRGPFTAVFSAVAVLPGTLAANPNGSVAINRVFTDNNSPGGPRFVVEFSATPGRSYTVIYSDNAMASWMAATPSITAGGTVVQWFDDGPPKTLSKPLSGGSRFYKVIANP